MLEQYGISVIRTKQKPGTFVLTFPIGYHGVFNCGSNTAEAVNVAVGPWEPYRMESMMVTTTLQPQVDQLPPPPFPHIPPLDALQYLLTM